MTVTRREYAGAAVRAQLNADITSGSTSIVLAASPGYAGWPTGATGPFYCSIDRGNSGEEKILVTSRSGNTLSGVTRGVDATSAAAHTSGTYIEHVATAVDFDEANAHIADVTRDDHTQYARKAQNGADFTNAATFRTNVGLAIGTNVQAFDTDLAALAALVSAANKMPYSTGAGTWALADLTAAGRALIDDADAAAQLTTLGVSTFIKTLIDDADAATARATLGLARMGGKWRRAAAQSASSGVQLTVSYDAEDADSNGILTPTSGLATIPTGGAGVWGVFVAGLFSGAIGTGRSYIEILTSTGLRARTPIEEGDSGSLYGEFDLADADTFTTAVLQTSGGALNWTGRMHAFRKLI